MNTINTIISVLNDSRAHLINRSTRERLYARLSTVDKMKVNLPAWFCDACIIGGAILALFGTIIMAHEMNADADTLSYFWHAGKSSNWLATELNRLTDLRG